MPFHARSPAERQEAARLRTVNGFEQALGLGTNPDLKSLVEAAARLCDTRIVLVTLVGEHRQWLKCKVGLDCTDGTSRAALFSAHVILHDSEFEVCDTQAEPLFVANVQFAGGPLIRFFAGAQITTAEGHRVAAL